MVGSFSISVVLKGVSDGFEWICLGVYGPTDGSLRDAMWAELDLVRSRWAGVGACWEISMLFVTRLRDLAVTLLVQLCLNSRISLLNIR